MRSCAVARQVHGVRVVEVGSSAPGQLHVAGEADGLVTATEGVLLAVTAADCVPVYVIDVDARRVALLHAGWRGAAAGIVERGLSALAEIGRGSSSLAVHLGPAICGSCYEVGEEVLRAFGVASKAPARLDLRAELAARVVSAGVPAAAVTRSEWCTRCGPVYLHSHRARGRGAGRMAAFVGLEARDPR
jgi:YfiH family protein